MPDCKLAGMKKLNRMARGRNNRGVSVILLIIALSIVQLTIDFFVFNLIRVLMVQRQISSVCESASLAGTSILAKLDVSDDKVNRKNLATMQKRPAVALKICFYVDEFSVEFWIRR